MQQRFIWAMIFWWAATVGCEHQIGEYRKLTPRMLSNGLKGDEGLLYDQRGIYRYMNGAGEIYKQYTFCELFVRTYGAETENPLIVEIFRFELSKDAFGIFSHLFDGQAIHIGQGGFSTGTSVGFWKGPYFGYLRSEYTDSSRHKLLVDTGKQIAGRIHEQGAGPDLLHFLPEEYVSQFQPRYFRSFTLLNAHYFIANEDILGLNEHTEVILASNAFKSQRNHLLLIRYPSAEKATAVQDNFRHLYLKTENQDFVLTEEGNWVLVRRYKHYLIILFDAPRLSYAQKTADKIQALLQKE